MVSQDHPLALLNKEITKRRRSFRTQIVLRDRTSYSEQNGILSTNTWSVHDLETKSPYSVGGLGWGNMPIHSITDEIRTGTRANKPTGMAKYLLGCSTVLYPPSR